MKPKQVIVMRTDLRNTKGHKITKGKYIAQGSHSSLGVLLDKFKRTETDGKITLSLEIDKGSDLDVWLNDQFTKVVLSCSSEEELMELYQEAKCGGLDVTMITDSGFTEFGGVPTNTCIAIGPDNAAKIDEITGHLNLFR